MSNEFNVWIGCLACYNAGRLVGEWFPADEAGEVTTSKVHGRDMTHWVKSRDERGGFVARREGLHEELWCFDVEAPHSSLAREMSPMEAQRIADVLADYDRIVGPDSDAFLAWLDYHGYSAGEGDDHFSDFSDAYCGEWGNEKDFAYNLAEEIDGVPEGHSWPASYIDWDAATSDLFMDYLSIDNPSGGVWVFHGC